MNSIIVEIRAAEGGDDSKDLILLQFNIYKKYCKLKNLKIDVLSVSDNIIIFKVIGKKSFDFFRNESGGLRWQRVPPTEKRGRVHTSTITIAVLPEVAESKVFISEKDIEWKAFRGSGPGGQHKNKTDSAVMLHHIPSGIKIRSESEKSQKQNKNTALAILRAKLYAEKESAKNSKIKKIRKNQVGSGMRGDKIRTIRLQDGIVINHLSNKKISFKSYLKGYIDSLYE